METYSRIGLHRLLVFALSKTRSIIFSSVVLRYRASAGAPTSCSKRRACSRVRGKPSKMNLKNELHSKRVEKIENYTRNEWIRCKKTLETSVFFHFLLPDWFIAFFRTWSIIRSGTRPPSFIIPETSLPETTLETSGVLKCSTLETSEVLTSSPLVSSVFLTNGSTALDFLPQKITSGNMGKSKLISKDLAHGTLIRL
jgi:hypothetical protein